MTVNYVYACRSEGPRNSVEMGFDEAMTVNYMHVGARDLGILV